MDVSFKTTEQVNLPQAVWYLLLNKCPHQQQHTWTLNYRLAHYCWIVRSSENLSLFPPQIQNNKLAVVTTKDVCEIR